MFNLQTAHFLTGAELNKEEICNLFTVAEELKRTPRQKHLHGKHLALLFDKPSLRTRFSFTVAMQDLGGYAIDSLSDTRKYEDPEDQIRVLQGYCDAVLVRTHDHEILQRMQKQAKIPLINGLSHLYHPCQILADLFTAFEVFQKLQGLVITYIGDANNILHSMLLMAPQLGIELRYCCPMQYQPDPEILSKAKSLTSDGKIMSFTCPKQAVLNSDVIYTDVWTSMGCESRDETLFNGYQVNEQLMESAKPHAVFMHCMPMLRGKEVSQHLPDTKCSVIFQQSENRLHVQKALLIGLLNH